MTNVYDDEDLDYLDALDVMPCPRPGCGSSEFGFDKELHAYICDTCGLWLDEEPDDYS